MPYSIKYVSLEIPIKIYIFLCILFPIFGISQKNEYNPDKKYSIQQLQEDFNIFRSNLEDYHQGLYLYSSAEKVNHYLDSLFNNINRPMTDWEFNRHITPFLNILKDGHTDFYFSSSWGKYHRENSCFFPFKIFYYKNQMYIINNYSSESSISIGSEIISINGLNVQEIFQQLINNQARDGNNTTGPEYKVQTAFPFTYFNEFGSHENYRLKYKDEKGLIHTSTVTGIPGDSLLRNMQPTIEKYFQFRTDSATNLAVMQIRSFDRKSNRKQNENLRKFLNPSFKTIKENNIQNLVIDIRGNGGGNVDRQLLRYLYDKPTKRIENMYLKQKKIKHTRHYTKPKPLWALNLWLNLNFKKDSSNYIAREFKFNTIQPKKNAFNKNLYVLIDGGSYSAAGLVASNLNSFTDAIFIGKETGGNSSLANAGILINFALPNTKNIIQIPIIKTKFAVTKYQNGRGTIPDYEIPKTPSDLITGNDPAMKFAIKLIQESQEIKSEK